MSKKKEVTLEEKLKEAIIPKEEQPYEIPNNWEWVKLESVIKLISGRDVSSNLCNSDEKGIPYILGASNIKENRFLVERWIEKPVVISKKNDILLSVKGTIGRIYLQKESEINISRQIMALRPYCILEKHYLMYFLKNNIEKLKEKGNGLIPGISREIILNKLIQLPPLEEQERIVKKLDSMLGRINEAKELIAQAKETFENRRASILNLAFSGELTRKWRESNSIESSKILLENLNKEKIRLWEEECEKALEEGKKKPLKPKLLSVEEMVIPKEEQPYEIPESWEWVKLERIILNTQYGYTEKSSNIGEIKYLRITDIQNENVNWKSVPFCKITEEDKKKYLLNKNDIVIARTGATTGKSYLITDIKLESVFASYLIRIRPILDIYKYLNKFFKSSLYWNQIIDMSSGIAQPGVNARKLETLNIPLPPIEEQKEIVRILDNVLEKEDKINEILEMEEMIELLEKSILDKAFRGELGTGNLEDVPSLEVLKNILEK